MACRISELVIDCADAEQLAAFWSEVLGYVELGREDDGGIEIGPPDVGFGGPQPTLILSPSSDPRTGKLRLHIDVNPTDRDQDTELERLLALGARPVDVGQADAEWHVLADPEGNEFSASCAPGSNPSDHVRPGAEPVCCWSAAGGARLTTALTTLPPPRPRCAAPLREHTVRRRRDE